MAEERLTRGYRGYSDKMLLSLHHGIAGACISDRTLTNAQTEAAQNFGSSLNYFGVDDFPDWKAHGEALESVLTERNISFARLVF